MTGEINKKANAEPSKKLTLDGAKRYAVEVFKLATGAGQALKKLAEDQLPRIILKEDPQPEEKDLEKNMKSVSLAYSLESGQALLDSIESKYGGFALQFKKELEEEFRCKKPSEKALVDQIVNAHIRKITYSKQMDICKAPKYLSHENIALLNFYSREIDRAHRQFISALEVLKFMKQPKLNVNIKTNNAFVGENQQFNNTHNQKDENNKPK